MRYSLEISENKIYLNNFFLVIIFFMSIFLHHSNNMLGINISLSDFFCVVALFFIIINSQLLIPTKPAIFFTFVSGILLFNSIFYVPVHFPYDPNIKEILSNFFKLFVLFVYFVLGYSLAGIKKMESVVKWYSLSGVVIGVVGILFTVLNINLFSQILFFGGSRFRGLMNDPNYYSILVITTLAYLSRVKNLGYRILNWSLILLSVLLSGSKTGLLTFFIYAFIRLIEYLFKTKRNIEKTVFQIFLFIFLIIISPTLLGMLQNTTEFLSNIIPSFSRIQVLFTDFSSAMDQDGSEREEAWGNAIEIIKISPLLGVGIGTYSHVAEEMFRSGNIAHNTYLQLCAEWGLPLAIMLFLYIVVKICNVSFSYKNNTKVNSILRDILLILLIGSIAISLNNARIFWIGLGALVFNLSVEKNRNQSLMNFKYEKGKYGGI